MGFHRRTSTSQCRYWWWRLQLSKALEWASRKVTGIVTGSSPVDPRNATQQHKAWKPGGTTVWRWNMMDGRQQSSSSMELEKPYSCWNATWPTSVDFRKVPHPAWKQYRWDSEFVWLLPIWMSKLSPTLTSWQFWHWHLSDRVTRLAELWLYSLPPLQLYSMS